MMLLRAVDSLSDLCAAVTWQGVVPERLVWSRHGSLVVIAMGKSTARTRQEGNRLEQHLVDDWIFVYSNNTE